MPRRHSYGFGPYARKARSRKKTPLGCLILFVIAAGIYGVIGKACGLIKPPSSDPRVKELGSFMVVKRRWEVLLIPRGLDTQQLVALARDIHARHPDTSYHLFDDDAQYKGFISWADHPREYPFPEQYVREHHVASIQSVYDKQLATFKWRLQRGVNHDMYGTGATIADLE